MTGDRIFPVLCSLFPTTCFLGRRGERLLPPARYAIALYLSTFSVSKVDYAVIIYQIQHSLSTEN
ncbi:hypothetical protein [Anabaena sp. CCY 9402-a]|uniref:hypothetical protein n=1 Tax=Anabaena sp. CCY 9402-a TaxID=3103867 RepID=UPI0039C6D1EE